MAVVSGSVNQVAVISSSIEPDGTENYSDLWNVQTDDASDGPIIARLATGIPRWQVDYYQIGNESNLNAIVRSKSAVLKDIDVTFKFWEVTCNYSTKGNARDPSGGGQQEPEFEPWKISGSYTTGTRATQFDKDGNVITISTEEPQILEVPSGHDTLILEGNSTTISLAERKAAVFKVNSTPIFGLAARELLLPQWQYEPLWRTPDTSYVRHRFEFWIKDGGWNEEYLDAGFHIISDYTTSPATLERIKDGRDEYVETKQLLDGGGQLADATTQPGGFKHTREVIKEYDFTSINYLPNPLPGPFV